MEETAFELGESSPGGEKEGTTLETCSPLLILLFNILCLPRIFLVID